MKERLWVLEYKVGRIAVYWTGTGASRSLLAALKFASLDEAIEYQRARQNLWAYRPAEFEFDFRSVE